MAVSSPALAVIVTVPIFLAVTTPLETVATVASDVVQVTVLSVASLGLTVAERVAVSPTFKEADCKLRVMLPTGADTTVIEQVAVLFPALAVIVAVPIFLAETTPLETFATVASELLQETVLSIASTGPTVALRVTDSPTVRDADRRVRVMLLTGVGITVIEQVAVLSPAFAVMVAVPNFLAVTTPLETVATVASDVVQVTVLSVASLGLTVAVRVTVSPTFREADVLLRVTLVTGVGITVIEQVAVFSPAFAVIVAVPNFLAVTTPLETVAIVASDVVQITVLSVASLGLTVALRVTVSPTFREAKVLLMVTLVTGVATTVIEQVAVLSPALAVIVAVPNFLAVTTPLETVATVASDVVQVTVLSVASLGLTVALRVTVSPTFREADVLLRVTLVTGVGMTVIVQLAVFSPALAVIVAVPIFLAVTTPLETVTTVASDVVQVTVLSVASSGPTVAVRVTVSPTSSDAVLLSSVIEETSVGTTVIEQVAVLSPALAVIVAVPNFFAVTTPLETVITVVSDDAQLTVLSVASSGPTVAMRVTVSPTFSEALLLSSIIEETSVGTTVIEQVAVLSPAFALMVAVPILSALTIPSSTAAMETSDEDQVTVLSLALLGLTVAERVTVSPTFNWMDVLSMDMDTTSTNSVPTFLQAENEKRRNASDRKNNASNFTLLRHLPAQFSIFSNIFKFFQIKC